MKERKYISLEQARRVGEALYIDWDQVDLKEFPDYHSRLAELEAEVDEYRAGISQGISPAVAS
jgi:hypothetical protein